MSHQDEAHTQEASSQSEADPSQAVIELPERLDIAGIAQFREHLATTMAVSREITLDGARLEQVDCAGMQLLVAFVADARAGGAALQWNNPSPPLTRAAQLLGLAGLLQLPSQS